jgi:uncharacterized damage-inducible protein DinB
MSAFAPLIDAFLAGPAKVRHVVRGLTPAQLQGRPVAGKWSMLEVVCHLADSDQAWAHRMKRVIAEDKPLLIGYDESRFAAALFYHDRDISVEFDFIDRTRRQLGQVLSKLAPETWKREGIHSERGLVNLEEMLKIEIRHIDHHLGFMAEKRKALGLEP